MSTTPKRTSALKNAPAPPATTRVAIYTRKSTEEGLDQEFNSLDAQRQAVEAYVQSQRSQGWVALADQYDDGGFTGANTDRPAFKRMLADIEAGRVDVVAVYKIDRLSRSLIDFAKLMELFDRKGVTFISVTQQFNTTSSMGRLTLNILMSFAEFERQVISERTSDKIRASRRKGIWCGGRPPLGYDIVQKKMMINSDEAERVRGIFRIYLERGSLLATCTELNERGWRNKPWKGDRLGHVIDKTLLHRMLTNPIYIGKVTYHDEVHHGQHEAIIDRETWDAVQTRLRDRRRDHDPSRNRWGVLLRGLAKCGVCGASLVHHFTTKGSKRYSFYVCSTQQKRGAASCPGSRISTRELEFFVISKVRDLGNDPSLVRETIAAAKRDQETKKPELIAELRRLDQDKRAMAAERTNLIAAIGQGGTGTPTLVQRLGELDEALAKTSQRAEGARAALVIIEAAVVDEDELCTALAAFDGIWAELFPREQARVLALLIDAVTFNGQANEVGITFRPGGIKALANQGARRSA